MMTKVTEINQQNDPPERPQADSNYFNVDESASELGVHPGTVRKAISDKRLKATRVYGRVVVSRVELERYRKRYYPDGVVKRGRGPGSTANAASEHDDRETN